MTAWFAIKTLHLCAVAVWLGASLTVPSDIRRTLTLGLPHTELLMPRLRLVARIMNASALLTVVTGLALIAAGSGFALVPRRIWLSLGLTALAIVVGRWMIRPVIVELAQMTKRVNTPDEIERVMRRFHVANGLEHVLRLAVLVLMIFPFRF